MRIVVGISGGVDSALATALLQERGFDVVGCFLKVAVPGAPCPWTEDLPMAHRVAAHLGIPLVVRDVSTEYQRDVLDPMVAAYARGETPNPDTMCNRWVKFDALAAVAREVSAEKIATGHYVRIVRGTTRDVIARSAKRDEAIPVELWRGVDHVKDQSYFLWMLTQEQLALCEFPIGEWRKEDVRAEAQRRGFPNWDRESTSGVCFLGQVNLVEFLAAQRTKTNAGGAACRGRQGGDGTPPLRDDHHEISATVVTTAGEVIGTIPSAESLTIGQRAPISGQSAPRYVVATAPAEQRVVVSTTPDDPARFTKVVTTGGPNWIGASPTFPLTCTARIRHRQKPVPCTVTQETMSLRGAERRGNPALRITFDVPLTGVAPGQAIVFTDGDRVLGGAVIARP